MMIRPRHVGDAHASVRRPIHVSTLDGVPRWGDTGRRGAHTQLCESLLQALVFDLQLQEGVEPRDGNELSIMQKKSMDGVAYMVTFRLGNGFATAKKQRGVDSLSI